MGYMYILECSDGTYYTGSTKNIERRILEHNGQSYKSLDKVEEPKVAECFFCTQKKCIEAPVEAVESLDERGANYTRKRRPVKLVYYEEYMRIDDAFNREKQVQGWSRSKKKSLIDKQQERLPELAKKVFDGASIHLPDEA